MPSKVVLITGCSTGIGRDVAEHLTRANFTVVATARHPETLDGLGAALKLPLDVTDPESIARAVAEVVGHYGRIDVLVNNAGYAIRAAVEELPEESVRDMFDVNVLGMIRMVRAVVPHMRPQRAGPIIIIGSIAGKLVMPVNGAYSATKFAEEALADAMRLELLPFGIRVVLIEPGNIDTNFAATSIVHSDEILSNPDSPYRPLYEEYKQRMMQMREDVPGPQVVSQVVQQAIEAPEPRTRYVVAVPWTFRVAGYFGDGLKDFALKQLLKIKPG